MANSNICTGKNCTSVDGSNHSPECLAEYERVTSGAKCSDERPCTPCFTDQGACEMSHIDLIVAALKHSNPSHPHYPEIVKRHEDALNAAQLIARILPELVADAGRMRGLRMIVCEPNLDRKLAMIDAAEAFLATQPDVGELSQTEARINEVIDSILMCAAKARSV